MSGTKLRRERASAPTFYAVTIAAVKLVLHFGHNKLGTRASVRD